MVLVAYNYLLLYFLGNTSMKMVTCKKYELEMILGVFN